MIDRSSSRPSWHATCPLARMIIDLRKAAQLCTESELALVASARGDKLKGLSLKRLELHIARARGLRDRFRDLAERQRREALGRAPPRRKRPARGNARSSRERGALPRGAQAIRSARGEAEGERGRPSTLGQDPRARAPPSAIRHPGRSLSVAARTPLALEPGDEAIESSPGRTGPRGGGRRPRCRSARRTRTARSHATRLRAHVGSRNRRSQAQRDAR